MKKLLVGITGLTLAISSSAFAQGSAFSPFVDANGNISRPVDFKTNPDWVHLGAWAVVNENNEGNGVHNVYTTHSAAESFRKNGVFPDGAPLVKEVRAAAADALTTGRAHWATDKQVWFVSIKDSTNRFPDNPLWGDGWGWALFKADAPATQVASDYQADCLSCHVPVKNSDWMYVHAYEPVLGPKALVNPPEYIKNASLKAPAAQETSAAADSGGIDLAAAKKSFQQTCKSCHSDQAGKNGIGPSLAGVVGRKAGTGEGFRYSAAMKSSDVVWSADTLDKHLLDVKNFIPKNRMGSFFPQGVKDDKKRAEIIAYLESISK